MHGKKYFGKLLLATLLMVYSLTVGGQIKIMDKPKVKALSVQKYDSLSNFEEKYYGQENPNFTGKMTYHHLIGQTILYCGSSFKNCKYGEYYKIESIITKKYLPYLRLQNKKTKQRVDVSGISYNTQFVVQGHYEKIKQLYVGKKYVFKQSPYHSDSFFFEVSTGNYAKIHDGSIWTCIDIQVENRSDNKIHKYSPLLMVFQSNSDKREIYCYYEAFYDMEEVANVEMPDSTATKNYLISKYGDKYGAALANSRFEKGMTKVMVESLMGNKTQCTKSTSITIKNGKTTKTKKWVYKNVVFDEEGNPLVLALFFDEKERLSDWTIEKESLNK